MPSALPSPPFGAIIADPSASEFGQLVQIHAKLCTQWFQRLSPACSYPHPPQSPPAFFFSAPHTPYTPFPEQPYRYSTKANSSPLLFSHAGLLRLHHIRELLPSHTPSVALDPVTGNVPLSPLLQNLLHIPTERGTAATRAAETAVEVVECVVRAGVGMVKKTAAMRWGIEHVLVGWEAISVLVKWARALEGMHEAAWDDEERRVVGRLSELLAEAKDSERGSKSPGGEVGGKRARTEDQNGLAIGVVRLWETVLGDTWVWYLTPMLGEALGKVRENIEKNTVA